MYSNHSLYGGSLSPVILSEFKKSANVTIASGYVSLETIKNFEPLFYATARRGSFRLLVGMAFYEGLSNRALTLLQQVDNKLSQINGLSGVFVCYTRRFHGKVYRFDEGSGSRVIVGSSNFSSSGLTGNFECSVTIQDPTTHSMVTKYIDFIFSPSNSVSINKASVPVTNSSAFKTKMFSGAIPGVRTYGPKTISTAGLQYFDFDLSRVVTDKQAKSNLNAYFGKGRLNALSGVVTPRPWYEVELISPLKSITGNSLYPKGDFTAYTDDGFIIPMRTQGDYYKNMRSRKSLQILGMWIKGKLQRANALIPLTPIDEDVLAKFGSDTIRFYKINNTEYFMEFR